MNNRFLGRLVLVLLFLLLFEFLGLQGFSLKNKKQEVLASQPMFNAYCHDANRGVSHPGLLISHQFSSEEECLAIKNSTITDPNDPRSVNYWVLYPDSVCGSRASCQNLGSCTTEAYDPDRNDYYCKLTTEVPACSVAQYDCAYTPTGHYDTGNQAVNCNGCPSKITSTPTPTPTLTPTATPTVTLTPTPIPGPQSPACDSLSASPANTGTAPLSVNFFALAHDPNGYISQYKFDFGDGTVYVSSGNLASHTYGQAGNYTAVLTVTDNQGLTATSDSCRITISPNTPFVTPPKEQPKSGTETGLTFGLILSLLGGILLRKQNLFRL